MPTSASTKRTVRTFVHAALGVLVAVQTYLPPLTAALVGTPFGVHAVAIAGTVAATVAVIAFVLNKLEDFGLLPGWLRSEVDDAALSTAAVPAAVANTTIHLHLNNEADVAKAVEVMKTQLQNLRYSKDDPR